MAFVVLSSLITVLMDIIRPGFSRIFLERLLTRQNPEWFNPFLTGFAVISCIPVLHLSMELFSQRMAGDIQSRQNENTSIFGTLINPFAPLAWFSIWWSCCATAGY